MKAKDITEHNVPKGWMILGKSKDVNDPSFFTSKRSGYICFGLNYHKTIIHFLTSSEICSLDDYEGYFIVPEELLFE